MVTPRVPLPLKVKSRGSGRGPALVCALAHALPLPLRLVLELPALDLRLAGQVLRDLLELVGAAHQLVGALPQLLTCDVARLWRVQQREHGTRQNADEEAHLSFSPFAAARRLLRNVTASRRPPRRSDRRPPAARRRLRTTAERRPAPPHANR